MTISFFNEKVKALLVRTQTKLIKLTRWALPYAGFFAGAFTLQKNSIIDDLFNVILAIGISVASVFAQKKIKIDSALKNLRKALSLYTTPELADFIIRDKSFDGLRTEQKTITVLFCDIRGYTSLSEEKSPAEVVNILNHYFSAMSEEIIRFRGVINKYIGDAILAFWEESPREYCQAENALFAAAAMLRRLAPLNKDLEKLGHAPLSIGIGICTGVAMVGNIGSSFKYDFTVIGDVVNVASRLQSLTKDYKVPIIVSDATRLALSSKMLFSLPSLGETKIRGKNTTQEIYTLDSKHYSSIH